jgi:hypothetical protein
MRIIRVLVYEGDDQWIRQTTQMRAVKGTLETLGGTITEYYLIESSLLGVLQNNLLFTGGSDDPATARRCTEDDRGRGD